MNDRIQRYDQTCLQHKMLKRIADNLESIEGVNLWNY